VTLDLEAPPSVFFEGEGASDLPADPSNLISTSMQRFAIGVGGHLPRFSLHGLNRIPLERGLGSSAAAVAAGVLLADRILGTRLSADDLLGAAVSVEGHPDNVAGALRGGLVLAYEVGSGWRAESLAPAPGIRPVALVPEARLSTTSARRALPATVAHSDAAFNAGRAALAVVAFTLRPALLGEALKDRLHQGVRLPLVPAVAELFQRLQAADVPVCLSGAGPSLLAFDSDVSSVPDPGPGWRVLRIPPRATGAQVFDVP
jgi:homoserine kinase